ncbi:MAG: bifunctional folylpolyglutamate synthase/dihydrofolate synthase [Calditrichia bacterium]
MNNEFEEAYRALLENLYGLQRAGVKYTLDNILFLLEAVDNPHLKWPSIHVAGTNGKGSTSAQMAAILQQAGYKTGLYTSPHLINFTERIRVNGREMLPADVTEFMQIIQPAIDEIHPSFYEVTTAMAFWEFARQKVDIAVIETGLGGRLDSTNVITPLISVITPIGMDHSDYLGDTLEAIAGEKAGIIKPGVPCITSNRDEAVLKVFQEKCKKNHSSFYKVFDYIEYQMLASDLTGTRFQYWSESNPTPKTAFISLAGEHQMENALLAIHALKLLSNTFPIPEKAMNALEKVRWPGRLDVIHNEPLVIVDVSHNREGFQQTMSFLKPFVKPSKTKIVLLLQSNKPYKDIAKQLSGKSEAVYVVDMSLGNPVKAAVLKRELEKNHVRVEVVNSIEKLQGRIDDSAKTDAWLIIGSHYLAGEVYNSLHLS